MDRKSVVDLGMAALVAAVVALEVASSVHPAEASAYVMGAALALPTLGWRRWPRACLISAFALIVAYYTVNAAGIPPSLVFAVPLYGVVLTGRRAWASAVVGCFYLLAVVDPGGRQDQLSLLARIRGTLPELALVGATILVAEMVRRYRVPERPNRAAADHDEAEDVVAERLRIARELHDALSHSIATISVQAGSALYALGERRSEVVHSALTAIRETSKDTMQELRTTLSGLREGDGGEDRDRAGLARLPALLDAVRAAGLPVEVEVSGPPPLLEPSVDHCAYRILQESLTNVLRHAGPQASASIRICYDRARLALEVTDDGAEVPAGLGEGKGLGLAGMRERAEAVGGACTAGPRPGGGFEVRALLPTGAAR